MSLLSQNLFWLYCTEILCVPTKNPEAEKDKSKGKVLSILHIKQAVTDG